MTQWFEDPRFWDGFKELLFRPERRAAAPAEVDALVALLGIAPPARVLDLCCGIGRHAAELARRGFTVTGVDLHEPYLAEARSAAPGAEWIRADMREFRRPGAFDAAINMFSSFAYFEDPADDYGDFLKPRLLSCPPAALSGYKPITGFRLANQKGRNDPLFIDRFDQFFQVFILEVMAWLIGIRLYILNGALEIDRLPRFQVVSLRNECR